MNKIKFSRGGQPVYLEDLQIMQENLFTLFGGMTQAVAGRDKAFLLEPVVPIFDFDSAQANVPSGKLVMDGIFYEFEGAVLDNATNASQIYVCVKTSDDDERTFEDGQTRYCREVFTAYLSTDKTGVEAYTLSELKTWAELLMALAVEGGLMVAADVTWMSGYKGTIKVAQISNGYEMEIIATSSYSSFVWPSANPESWVFSYDANFPGFEILKNNVRSDEFEYAGVKYYLALSAQGCLIRKKHDDECTGVPIMPINIKIRY